MTKYRGFLVVLQDDHKGNQSKQDAIAHLMTLSVEKAVVAREPYGHQEGSHIHVFYRLKSQSDFKTQLKHWVLWYKTARAQVDVMKGTMAQACRYLMQDETKKNKDCDPDPWFYPTIEIAKSPGERADDWLDWFISVPIASWRQMTTEHKDRCLEFWSTAQNTARSSSFVV